MPPKKKKPPARRRRPPKRQADDELTLNEKFNASLLKNLGATRQSPSKEEILNRFNCPIIPQ